MKIFGRYGAIQLLRSGRAHACSLAVAGILALTLGTAHAQQMAGSVEDGLRQLASVIAERSTASGRNTVAVLPFAHADGSCSVFSTYVVDELILSLFSLPNAGLDIVERSQLEAIISELAMGEGGLLNPATTKELGNISGVNALTLGTITVIGDSVRLNARLVATDTGKTISAAAVTIPKTQAIATLLGQPAACATTATGGRSVNNASPQVTSRLQPQGEYPEQTREGIHLELRRAGRQNGHQSQSAFMFRATNAKPIPIRYSVSIDDISYADSNGNICSDYYNRTKIIGSHWYAAEETIYAAVMPGDTAQFSVGELNCESSRFSKSGTITIALIVAEDGQEQPKRIRFSFFDVPFVSD